jgi:hypothetical protein
MADAPDEVAGAHPLAIRDHDRAGGEVDESSVDVSGLEDHMVAEESPAVARA